jgi:mannose-6-phosphate isomerase-like protein (cupin superfamily)
MTRRTGGSTVTATVPPAPQSADDRLLWSFNMLMDVKATAEDTGGTLSVIDSWLTPAANPPLHVHHGADEAFLLLEGEVAFFLGDGTTETFVARAGDFVFGPRGVPHRFEVRTPEARMVVLGTPGGGERFFRALGEPAAARELPVPAAPDVERVVHVAAEHAIDILPPPA